MWWAPAGFPSRPAADIAVRWSTGERLRRLLRKGGDGILEWLSDARALGIRNGKGDRFKAPTKFC